MIVLYYALVVAQCLLALGVLFSVYRLVKGPSAPDRVLATDALYINGMLLLLTFGMLHGTVVYFEAALIVAGLGFVGTTALAKFLLRGEVIE